MSAEQRATDPLAAAVAAKKTARLEKKSFWLWVLAIVTDGIVWDTWSWNPVRGSTVAVLALLNFMGWVGLFFILANGALESRKAKS